VTSASARRVAWSAVAVGWTLVVGAAVLNGWAGDPAPHAPEVTGPILGPIETLVLGLLLGGLFGGTGALIVSRFPSNLLGWTFTFGALVVSTIIAGTSYGYAGLVARPGALPAARHVQVLFGDAMWLPLISIQIVPLLLLFPDGRLDSPGRRWTLFTGLAGSLLGTIGVILAPKVYAVDVPNPFAIGSQWVSDLLAGVGVVLVLGAAIAAAGSLVGRFRRSHGDERQQMKWFVFAAGLMFVAQIATNSFETPPEWLAAIGAVSTALVPVAVGVAILRYRLYDIDVVINKTVVYAVLAAFITLVFLVLVVGVGTIVGGGSTFLAAVAAAVVALVFQPIRRWAQHLANRLVYGARATPYEVLSGFSERLAETYSIEDVLPRTARVLAEGLGADGIAIVLREDDRHETIARWPADVNGRRQEARSFEVRHQGELLGEIEVAMPPGVLLDASRETLVRDVAAQAGLVLRNVALIGDLRASRARLVAAQSEERRRIERNIHDGAQQQLVALAVKLRLADSLVGRDEARMHELLTELQRETNDALEDLRDFARGIYPPLLADQGLGAALASQSRKAPVPVVLETDGIGRYPQETEAAVYFSCLEALQNVAKYAKATSATVRLTQANGGLTFEVTDDGIGFDPVVTGHGSGLQGIADRLAALGGELEIRSSPGSGTTVAGRLPATLAEASR
jgi:signal transduction histidine kinase